MSSLVLYNIIDEDVSDIRLRDLEKDLIQLALAKDKGIRFNCMGYCDDLVLDCNMRESFILTDNFSIISFDYLDTFEFNVSNRDCFKTKFNTKYKILEDILNILKERNIKRVDFYVTTDGSVLNKSDFNIVVDLSGINLLDIVFEELLRQSKICAYGFPTLLVRITL